MTIEERQRQALELAEKMKALCSGFDRGVCCWAAIEILACDLYLVPEEKRAMVVAHHMSGVIGLTEWMEMAKARPTGKTPLEIFDMIMMEPDE